MRRPLTLVRSRLLARCDECGMSVAVLLVSLSLMVVVVGAAWAFAGVMQRGQAVSDREAALSRSIGIPLARIQEIVLQNTSIDRNPAPTAYMLAVRTDQNLDDVLEQHTFTATGSGTITETGYLLASTGARVGGPFINAIIGTDNVNRSNGIPLFRYYDENHVEITDMGLVPLNARFVVVSICSTVSGRTVRDDSTVQFRNRD